MLSRMSLGIAGYGRLGRMVAGYGRAFGMTVRYFDPFVPQVTDCVRRVASLKALVSDSDIVSVHVPHEPATEHLFDREIFSSFKEGAFFINTSRGELVDQLAMLDGLQSGRLGGAAIDVLAGEFSPGFAESLPGNPLVRYACSHTNLLLTPHIGGSTQDAWRLTEQYTIEKILERLSD
jgi:D-3-phosphoglycerate dehydrogenase